MLIWILLPAELRSTRLTTHSFVPGALSSHSISISRPEMKAWTDAQLDLLKQYRTKAYVYYQLHNNASSSFSVVAHVLSILVFIIAALCGILLFVKGQLREVQVWYT
jgi:hypothetical protein